MTKRKKIFRLEKNDKKHLIVFILLLFCVLYNVLLSLFFYRQFLFFTLLSNLLKYSDPDSHLTRFFFLVPSLITNVCRSGSLYRKDTFNRGVFGVVFVFLWNCVSSFNSIVTSFVLTGFFCDARVNWIGGGGSILYHPRGWLGWGGYGQ